MYVKTLQTETSSHDSQLKTEMELKVKPYPAPNQQSLSRQASTYWTRLTAAIYGGRNAKAVAAPASTHATHAIHSSLSTIKYDDCYGPHVCH